MKKTMKCKCIECKYMKCYGILHQMYYCNHPERIDDMGKLSKDKLPEIVPDWCPVKENV